MENRLQELLEQIMSLEEELRDEIQQQEEKLSYEIRERTIKFKEEVSSYHQQQVMKINEYLKNAPLKHILTAPIIWLCLFPALLLDIIVTLYQFICFPLYNIPKVKRKEYIVLDRGHLKYLNIIQKINCLYCGYFNGLMSYVREIAARTEQYWCPIKHALRLKDTHTRYAKFADFGDCDTYMDRFDDIRQDFSDLKGEQK